MKKIFKAAYRIIPFKKEIFSVLKKFWTPSESIYKHLYFTGIIKVKVDETHSFKVKHYGYQVENHLFWQGLTGGHEKISMSLWTKLCKNSPVIFDIGANTGVFSLIAKSVNPSSKVFAFEPVDRIVKKLQANADLNNYNITVIGKAASNFDGTATIYDPQSEHLYSVTVNKNLNDPESNVAATKIETITLSSVIKQYNLDHIDLMKIDVETHEAEVLEGLAEYLKLFKPTMLIEILNDEVGKNVQNIISGEGYLYFNIDEKSGVRLVNEITKSDYFNYLLCTETIARELGILHA